MAINVNVIGRLGMDSEVREGKNGNKFVTMRLATDEFKNGKNETVWLNIFDYSDRAQKMCQYWKKGTMLQVHGTESVSVYQNKNGEYVPSRDIRAYSIEFVNGGNKEQNAENANDATPRATTATSSVTPQVTTGTFVPQTPTVPQFTTVSPTTVVDDLPF